MDKEVKMNSADFFTISLAVLFAGCATMSQSARNCDEDSDSARTTVVASTAQASTSASETTETIAAAVSKKSYAPGRVIGSVGCVNGSVVLDKGVLDGVVVAQTVLICVREQSRLVTICEAEAVPSERSSTLKLNIRNVEDEDGDLVAVEDGSAAKDFRAAPAKFIAEHKVFAVAMKTKAASTEGRLK